MKNYKMKVPITQARVIDSAWLLLLREQGYNSIKVNDYHYLDVAGNPQVMEKDCFERLFDLVE